MTHSLRVMLAAGCAATIVAAQPVRPSRAADTIFVGSIVTLDPSHPTAHALAVTAGRIVAIGEERDMTPVTGPRTTRVTLPGVALPGLADAHIHPLDIGEQLELIDLHGLGKAEILARVAAVARTTPAGAWIRGTGWDQGYWQPPVFPTAAELDRVSTRHPILLDRIDGHSMWVNTMALTQAGVSSATADPEGGRIVRDPEGRPSGILVDHATALVRRVVPGPTSAQSMQRLRAALNQFTAWGLTSVHDAGATVETIALYQKLLDEGHLPLRVYVMASGTGRTVPAVLARGPEVGLGGGLLTIRSFKVVLDGALGSRGAQLAAPYADAPAESGLETMSDSAFRELVRGATARGFQVNAHAIGDRAVRRALDAFEFVGPDVARHRFRVEHASIVDPVDRARFAALGVIASMQPVFAGEYSRWADDRVGQARASWVLPIRSMIASRAAVAFGTDYPSSDSGDPIVNLFSAVTRRGADGSPSNGWHPGERVEVTAALKALTAAPAFAAFQENNLGSLTEGRYADLSVLSANPQAVPAASLRELKVLMTIVGGRIVFQRTP